MRDAGLYFDTEAMKITLDRMVKQAFQWGTR
jgi:hypothetical protein